ncbi:MAG: hypothetical protein QGG09_14180 [Pirellulaceae bacterium]|jgi:hypothetical protein|nr:hypothetical protein [Pirellulaceae bacterium]HJN07355.1 hypothetical protein [Pirellulaceae bacterium]
MSNTVSETESPDFVMLPGTALRLFAAYKFYKHELGAVQRAAGAASG